MSKKEIEEIRKELIRESLKPNVERVREIFSEIKEKNIKTNLKNLVKTENGAGIIFSFLRRWGEEDLRSGEISINYILEVLNAFKNSGMKFNIDSCTAKDTNTDIGSILAVDIISGEIALYKTTKILDFLLNNIDNDVLNYTDSLGNNAIFYCKHNIHASKLISRKIDYNLINKNNENALFSTIKKMSVVNLLLNMGLNPKQKNKQGVNVFECAIKNGSNVVELLLKLKHYTIKDVPKNIVNIIKTKNVLKCLYEYGWDINTTNSDGENLLFKFGNSNLNTITRYLLEKKINATQKDINGNTVLHYPKNIKIAGIVYASGLYDIEIKNNEGKTALQTLQDYNKIKIKKPFTEEIKKIEMIISKQKK